MADESNNFELLLTRGRALSICYIIAEQVSSEIVRAAKVSAHLKAGFCTSGPEIRSTTELLGLQDRREVDKLRSLGKGQCIVSLTGDRCPRPLHLRIPILQIDRSNLSHKERAFYLAKSLQDLRSGFLPRYAKFFEKRQANIRREKDPSRLSYDAWKVFVRIAGDPTETIEDRMAALGKIRAEEETARKECSRKGYIKVGGTYGWGVKLFELTDKGRNFAEKHNIPVRTYKSGVVHEALLKRVKKGISAAYTSFRWLPPKSATGSIQPDAYGLFPNGRSLCLQINCQNKTNYECQRLMDLCAIDHIDLVIIALPTKKAVIDLAISLSKNWKKGVPECYVPLSATECLADDYDWTTVLKDLT